MDHTNVQLRTRQSKYKREKIYLIQNVADAL